MSTYIGRLADNIEARIPAEAMPEGDTRPLFLIYASLALAKGREVTRRDVHNAWAAWMASVRPDHPSIRPFDDLPEDKRREDDPFVAAIRGVAE
jgi:hypothetical protein